MVVIDERGRCDAPTVMAMRLRDMGHVVDPEALRHLAVLVAWDELAKELWDAYVRTLQALARKHAV